MYTYMYIKNREKKEIKIISSLKRLWFILMERM